MCQSQEGLFKLYPPILPLRRLSGGDLAAWLAESQLLAGDIESNPGQQTHTAICTIAQLRTNKSHILISYLHKVDETHYPSPLCPLCKTHPHTTEHIFKCTHLYTLSNILDLWMSPGRVVSLLARWKGRLEGLPELLGLSDPSTATRRRGGSTTLTTDQVIKGISNCSNTKAFDPDKLSIFHLKNLGPTQGD